MLDELGSYAKKPLLERWVVSSDFQAVVQTKKSLDYDTENAMKSLPRSAGF